jgi:hypothetical protein
MARKTRNLLTAKLKRALITCFEEFKKHNELRPKQLSTVFFHNPAFFLTLANTLKTKVGGNLKCYPYILHKMVKACFICEAKNVRLFEIPSNMEQRQKWFEAFII